MNVINRVQDYLDSHDVRYQLISHAHSNSSVGSAISADVPMHSIAKAVILEDHEGRHMMAIVPADYKVNLIRLNDALQRKFHLVKESQIYKMFEDCDHGAIPPIPEVYHMDAVVDNALMELPEIFLESGDHETLIRLDRKDYGQLISPYRHIRFSQQVLH